MKLNLNPLLQDDLPPPDGGGGFDDSLAAPDFRGVDIYEFYHPDFQAQEPASLNDLLRISDGVDSRGGWVVDAGYNGTQEDLALSTGIREIPEEEVKAGRLKAFVAGAVQENTLLSALDDELSDVDKSVDVSFDATLEPTYSIDTYAPYQADLVRTQNRTEYDATLRQIDKEMERRQFIADNPVSGGAGMFFTQLVSPEFWGGMLIPALGAARVGKPLASAAELLVFGALQEGFSEGVKLQTQITRTNEEALMNIGAAALIGGVIGGGVGMYGKRQMNKMADATVKDFKDPKPVINTRQTGSLQEMTPEELKAYQKAGYAWEYDKSLSAAKVDAVTLDDYALAPALGLENISINPVMRLAKSPVLTARKMTSWLVNNPMYNKGQMKGINTSSEIGSVETRVSIVSDNAKALLITTLRDEFAKYRDVAKVVNGQAKASDFGELKTTISDLTGRSQRESKLTWDQFKEMVALSLRRNSQSDIPEVFAAANKLRDKVYIPYLKSLQELEMLPAEIEVNGAYASRYLNRVWDAQKVIKGRRVVDASGNLVGGLEFKLANYFQQQQLKTKLAIEKAVRDTGDSAFNVEGMALEAQAKNLKDSLEREVQSIKSTLAADFNPNKTADVKRVLGLDDAPKSLAVALRERGGLYDSGGELAARDISNRSYVGLIKKDRSIKAGDGAGLSDDTLREWLWDNGYTFGARQYDEIDLSDVFDALADEVHNGVKVWDDEIAGKLGGISGVSDGRYINELEAGGLGRQSSKADIEQYVLERRGSPVGREEFYGQVQKLEKEAKRLQAETTQLLKDREEMAEWLSMDRNAIEALARETVDNILSLPRGQLALETLPDNRIVKASPLKSRLLGIDDAEIEDFLDSDVENVVNKYINTLTPQMELKRTFGTSDMKEVFDDLANEYSNLRERVGEAMKAKGASDEQIASEMQRLTNRQMDDVRDVTYLRDRVLGTAQRPADPDAFWQRASQFVKRYNLVRLLGGMQLAALPDLARPIMVKGFKPYIRTLKAINTSAYKLAKDEAQRASVGFETLLNGRMKGMADLLEDGARRNKLEKAADAAAIGFGKVTGMSYHNDFLKSFSGVMIQDDILRAARAVMEGSKLSKKQLRDMAKSGLGRKELERIADEMKAGKFTDEGGLLVPHSDDWDAMTKQAMFSAIRKSIDEVIVTVGRGDVPIWMSSELGSLTMQFKSFLVSSHSRVLISGLQAHDMAVAEGLITSIGLGYAVYSLKNALAGRENSDDFGTQLLEASDRAGVFGLLGEAYAVANKVSGGTLSVVGGGEQLTRMQSRNLMDAFLGPSFGMANDALAANRALFTGDVSEGDVKTLRKLLPYQNLWYMDFLFDALQEKGTDNFVTN
jgi:hypothetical protein